MPGSAYPLASQRNDSLLDISENPRALIENILIGNPDEAIAGLIQHLGRPGYSIVDLLGDVRHFKEEIARAESKSDRLIDRWMLLDRTVERCLALTTSSHEEYIDKTLHAFCYYNSAGIIVGANNKMMTLNPECIGRHVATCFGKMEDEVKLALAGGSHRLYELELQVQAGQLPVLAEFGTIETGLREGGYALLVDMSDLASAEKKAFESAPYGMLKLDAKHRVLYASQKALNLLELSREDVLGRDARRFITDKDSLTTVMRQSIVRRKGIGGDYEVLYTKPKSNKQIPVRITSVPSFDAAGVFSGSIIGMQPIDYLRAREEIARLIGTLSDYEELYTRIVEIVKGFIEFDWANLFIYSPNRDYSRIVCTRGPEIEFVSRWFSTPDGYVDWLDQTDTWMSDLKEDISRGPNPEYLERTDAKVMIAAGMRALVCLPIRSGGRIIGGFCLASKQKGIYGAESRRTLEHLTLEQAFLPLYNAIETAERDFVNGLVKEIAGSEDMQQVADKVVRELARFYEYQNVSIFKVNVLRGHVGLLAQALGPKGGTPMPSGYSQSIDDGVLGLCYRRGDYVILKDREDNSEEAKCYVRVSKKIRSELCIPIRLFQRVLWILNLEDCLSEAFTLIEVEKLQEVIQQMQATLERIFQSLVLVKVLDVCPAAVVITDQKHNILRCNRQARQMMEQDPVTSNDNLDDFFSESPTTFAADPAASTFLGARGKGKKIQVLASRFTLEEEYDHVVFMLQNVADLEWTAKFEILRAAIAETTAQVRVPVSLLSSFVQRIGQQTEDAKLQDLARKATRQIGRVELTYDRVLASYEAQTLPAKRNAPVDLKRALDLILTDLPELERKAIRVSDNSPGTVMADPFRVFFALSSMLAYLLRSRSNAERIVITTVGRDRIVEVSMTGAVPKTPRVRHLAAIVEATRTEIALGKDVLIRIAKEAGGDFVVRRESNGRERLSLRLATPEVGGAS
jgi:GAF domain-containing protein